MENASFRIYLPSVLTLFGDVSMPFYNSARRKAFKMRTHVLQCEILENRLAPSADPAIFIITHGFEPPIIPADLSWTVR